MITFRLATRKSPLARAQARLVQKTLQANYPDMRIQLLPLQTQGDALIDALLQTEGGKGLFIKEIEQALLDGKADIAVHSMKDMPTVPTPSLVIPAVLPREDPRDVWVCNDYACLSEVPSDALIGTASLRRQAMVKYLKPTATVLPVRGNVETRLSKLDKKNYTALILAAAGLKRLKLAHRIQHYFSLEQSIPAQGQGVIGIQCRQTDTALSHRLKKLNHWRTFYTLWIERHVMHELGGHCHAAIGVYASLKNDTLDLQACVYSPDGKICLKTHIKKLYDKNKHRPHEKPAKIKLFKNTALDAVTSLRAQGAENFLIAASNA